jgi:hypothetical protein
VLKLNTLALNKGHMDVKTAIRNGDAAALQLLAEDSSRANELIRWVERKPCFTHPLHFISDMLFEGTLPQGKETRTIVWTQHSAHCKLGGSFFNEAMNASLPLWHSRMERR